MPLPHPLTQQIHDLYAIPRLFGLSGRVERFDFLFRSNETGVPLLYRWHDGVAQLLTPGEEPVAGFAALHATEPWVILAQDEGGSENYNIFRLDYETGTRTQITVAPIGRVGWMAWLRDDAWLVLGGDDDAQYVRVLNADGSMRTLFTNDRWLRGSDYDATTGRLAVSVGRGASSTNYDIAVIDVASGETVAWVRESEASEEANVAVHAGKLAYASNVNPTGHQVVIRSLIDLAEVARFNAPGDVEDLAWLDEETLALVIGRDATQLPHLLNIITGTWSGPLGDRSTWSLIVTAAGPAWNGSTLEKPNAISRYQAGGVEDLITVDYDQPTLPPEAHWFPSFDDRQVHGWLLRQPDPAAPLVVYVHGGPTSVTANMWRETIQALVLAGFHVFAPNVRGSTTFGTEFRDLNIGDLGGGDMHDVLAGARYAMRELGHEAPPAITGRSYGGFLTLFALTTQPDDWAGGVAVVPVADWVEDYYLLDAGFRFYDEHFFGGTPEEKPELYRERSPITHLERLRAPTLILHGENDSRCAIQPVLRFAQEARRHGKPVEIIVTEAEGHGSLITSNAVRETVHTLVHLRRLDK
jgi:dipeptidyl aminopeptidase/acylaminoacyl peptidase